MNEIEKQAWNEAIQAVLRDLELLKIQKGGPARAALAEAIETVQNLERE